MRAAWVKACHSQWTQLFASQLPGNAAQTCTQNLNLCSGLPLSRQEVLHRNVLRTRKNAGAHASISVAMIKLLGRKTLAGCCYSIGHKVNKFADGDPIRPAASTVNDGLMTPYTGQGAHVVHDQAHFYAC